MSSTSAIHSAVSGAPSRSGPGSGTSATSSDSTSSGVSTASCSSVCRSPSTRTAGRPSDDRYTLDAPRAAAVRRIRSMRACAPPAGGGVTSARTGLRVRGRITAGFAGSTTAGSPTSSTSRPSSVTGEGKAASRGPSTDGPAGAGAAVGCPKRSPDICSSSDTRRRRTSAHTSSPPRAATTVKLLAGKFGLRRQLVLDGAELVERLQGFDRQQLVDDAVDRLERQAVAGQIDLARGRPTYGLSPTCITSASPSS